MKNYIKPTACVVELQAKENIALNPLDAATVDTSTGVKATIYNMAFFDDTSVVKPVV